jgi:hypothetical protein
MFGFVARDRIIGRAVGVVMSLDDHTHQPRWQRFFHGLPSAGGLGLSRELALTERSPVAKVVPTIRLVTIRRQQARADTIQVAYPSKVSNAWRIDRVSWAWSNEAAGVNGGLPIGCRTISESLQVADFPEALRPWPWQTGRCGRACVCLTRRRQRQR